MIIMGEPDQIEGLLGDVSFATIERGAQKTIDHLDQRGGPYNGVELIKRQGFARVKCIAKEPFGARQPEIAFSVMVTLLLRLRLEEEMIMVPRQHEKIYGIVRNHGTEFRINRFGLCTRDSDVIDMLVHGLERGENGNAVECCDPVEKQRQFRAHAFDGAQFPIRRAAL
jgi:hypothetical protein